MKTITVFTDGYGKYLVLTSHKGKKVSGYSNNSQAYDRVKKTTHWRFDCKKLEFVYNNAGVPVSSTLEPFITAARKAADVRQFLNEDEEFNNK